MLTKFDELTDILTDVGKDDFFQATYSDDQIPTSPELAEGLSTNVPASSRIPTVIGLCMCAKMAAAYCRRCCFF